MVTRSRYKKKSAGKKRTGNQKYREVLLYVIFVILALIIVSGWIFLQEKERNSYVGSSLNISVNEVFQKYPDVYILDVREIDEYQDFHIPGSMNIPLSQLSTRTEEIPDDIEIVVICRTGNRSQEGQSILLQAGHENVFNMVGGVEEWRSRGYPIEP